MKKKLSNLKLRTKIEAVVAASILLSLIIVGSSFGNITISNSGMVDSSGQSMLTSTASFIVFTDGTTTYAKNGSTGLIDSSNINSIIVLQYAVNASGKIYIKNGIYDIGSSTLEIPSNTSVIGEGWGAIIYQSISVNAPVIANKDRASGNTNIIIANIAANNTAPYAGSDQVVYEFEKCTGIRVTRVYGESVYDGIEFCRSSDCIIEDSRFIALAGNTDSSASGIEFDHSDGGTYLKAVNNYIQEFPNGIALDAKQQGSLIQGNTIIDSVKYGIYLSSPVVEGTTQWITIIGNYIDGTQDIDAIRIAATVHDIIISENIAVNNNLHGCRVFGSSNVTITGNIFSNNHDGIKIETTGANVPDNIMVEDNILLNNSNLPFEIAGSPTNVTVRNNIGYNNNSLFPFYEQNAAPTIADNCTAYWYDLDDDYMYQITNSYGTVWYVNMTTTI